MSTQAGTPPENVVCDMTSPRAGQQQAQPTSAPAPACLEHDETAGSGPQAWRPKVEASFP